MNINKDKITNSPGPETIRLVGEWMRLALESIQPLCYSLLIQDVWETEEEKINAQADAIACIGIEKILEVVEITNACFDQHKEDNAPPDVKKAFIELVK